MSLTSAWLADTRELVAAYSDHPNLQMLCNRTLQLLDAVEQVTVRHFGEDPIPADEFEAFWESTPVVTDPIADDAEVPADDEPAS